MKPDHRPQQPLGHYDVRLQLLSFFILLLRKVTRYMAIDSTKFKGKFFFDALLNKHLKKCDKDHFLNSKRLLLFHTYILKEYDLLQVNKLLNNEENMKIYLNFLPLQF